MKWSSQPGARTGTNASSTLAPERSIAVLNVSSWRLMASGPFDLTGPRAMTRTVTGGIGFSPGNKNQGSGIVHVAVEIGEFVTLAGGMPGGRRLPGNHWARLDAGEMGGVMSEAPGRPELAIADAIDPGFDLSLDRFHNRRHDLRGDDRGVGYLGAGKPPRHVLPTLGRRQPADMRGSDPRHAPLHVRVLPGCCIIASTITAGQLVIPV